MRKIGVLTAAWMACAPMVMAQQEVTATAQVYDRITAFSLPGGFFGAFENEKDGGYLLEFVREGETIDDWSEMITLSGAKGLASEMPDPLDVASVISGGFRDTCPDTYTGSDEGQQQVAGADAAHLVLFSCGADGGATEIALILIAVSGADVFTLQWAERGGNVPPEPALWLPRFETLLSLRLCPVVEGEEPPYPSCNP